MVYKKLEVFLLLRKLDVNRAYAIGTKPGDQNKIELVVGARKKFDLSLWVTFKKRSEKLIDFGDKKVILVLVNLRLAVQSKFILKAHMSLLSVSRND
ncbi:hypothetical protein GWI33_001439 [Rhynchophorus ferrugineus]|uniref:Uncharacterized protein n=1 Tax=Rhynchophorus ferrugineus TaxID=354439 RepID=A0A834MKL3_RHYFE|nr:hypothetical protein GWI33_001439 [Rhynchophorus ferrugineus]